jgi:hypothetical protein
VEGLLYERIHFQCFHWHCVRYHVFRFLGLPYKGTYESYQIAFYWFVAALASAVIGILALYQYYVIQPSKSDTLRNPPKERPPYVIFRATSVRPLAVGQYPIIQYELENIGTVEARVVIKNPTRWFTQDLNQRSFEYPAGGESKSIIAPTQKLTGQLRLVEHILTDDEIKALNEERGRLVFFAQGEYTDQLGTRTYQLPFCRMYHPDFVGNVIFCEDDITFKKIGESKK